MSKWAFCVFGYLHTYVRFFFAVARSSPPPPPSQNASKNEENITSRYAFRSDDTVSRLNMPHLELSRVLRPRSAVV